MALRNVLILKPRSGCLEGRMTLIQPLANSFSGSNGYRRRTRRANALLLARDRPGT
jgi:hypothetical protein